MNRDYYVEYYELERNHWWFKVREKIIEDTLQKYIEKKTSLQILNIGAATGKTSQMLSNYGVVTSIEYDKECCDFTREKLGIEMVNASILELPYLDNYFDLVCAFDVIEHVQDDLQGVKEMQRVCKNDGHIYITVPAFSKLWSHHDVVNHHFRRYVLKGVMDLFKALRGRVIYTTYFNSILFPAIFGFRTLSNILGSKKRDGAGSDFSAVKPNQIIDGILFKIFSIERYILKRFTFPMGVSLLFLWRKSNSQ